MVSTADIGLQQGRTRQGKAKTRSKAKTGAQRARAAKATDESVVEKLIEKISKLRAEEGKGKKLTLEKRIELGKAFKSLKESTRHGEWEKALKRLKYHESTARRLMKVASSWLATEIETMGPDLVGNVPSDLQKLALLIRADAPHAKKVLAKEDLDHMKRRDLRARLGLKARKPPEDGSSTEPSDLGPQKVADAIAIAPATVQAEKPRGPLKTAIRFFGEFHAIKAVLTIA